MFSVIEEAMKKKKRQNSHQSGNDRGRSNGINGKNKPNSREGGDAPKTPLQSSSQNSSF